MKKLKIFFQSPEDYLEAELIELWLEHKVIQLPFRDVFRNTSHSELYFLIE